MQVQYLPSSIKLNKPIQVRYVVVGIVTDTELTVEKRKKHHVMCMMCDGTFWCVISTGIKSFCLYVHAIKR